MLDNLRNTFKGKRVLITGHTGFKGSWLSLWLIELGAEVIGYALDPPSNPSLFEICGLNKKLLSIKGDVRNFKTLRHVFTTHKPDIVFHMAAQSLVRYSYREPLETYNTNVMGTLNTLEICRLEPSVKAIINVTSDKCYDNREWIWGYREIDPIGGADPYSSSKACAELVTRAYIESFFNSDCHSDYETFLASVRAGNVIGGGDWGEDRLIPDCIKALTRKKPIVIRYPEAVRPWQHVLEPLYGYLLVARHLLENGPEFSGAWNFGPYDRDAKPVKWIADRIVEMWGNGASWIPDLKKNPQEARYLKLDSSKAQQSIGWSPQWNVEMALAQTIEWYKDYSRGKDMLTATINHIRAYEDALQNMQ